MSDHRDDASPLRALRRLSDDQEASAAVEFIVLLPVYIAMLAALFMMANLAMVRQAIVQNTRFAAWAPQSPDNYAGLTQGSTAFFGPYPGTLEYETGAAPERTVQDVTFDSNDLTSGGVQNEHAIAADALNNVNRGGTLPTLRRTQVRVTYTYSGVFLQSLGITELPQTAECVAILPNGQDLARRPEYISDKPLSHPVLHWRTQNNQASYQDGIYYDPTQPANMPLSPYYDSETAPGSEFLESHGGTNPGLWDRNARIGGSDRQEQGYFGTELPYPE